MMHKGDRRRVRGGSQAQHGQDSSGVCRPPSLPLPASEAAIARGDYFHPPLAGVSKEIIEAGAGADPHPPLFLAGAFTTGAFTTGCATGAT